MKTVILMPNPEDGYQFYFDRDNHRLRPNVVMVDRDGGILFEINEAGLKGEAFDPHRKLAVVWGDSVVFSAGRGWPCLLDRFAPHYQFLNGGIEGDLWFHILERAAALNRERPVALNLLMLGWHPFPDNRNLRSGLLEFLRRTPNTVVMTMPTALNPRLMDIDLTPYLTARFIDDEFRFCGNIPYSRQLQVTAFNFIGERNAIAGEVAAATGTRLIDLFAHFDTTQMADFREDFHDVVHLRTTAYTKIVAAVYAGIADLVADPAVDLRVTPTG